MSDLDRAGYPLATTRDAAGSTPRTLEVFPHPALLRLLRRPYRVPYKVGNSSKYWPGVEIPERISSLLAEFKQIECALRAVVGETHVPLPVARDVRTLAHLKRYEDSLDALVSAWVGVQYASRAAVAYGDADAAIWVPALVPAVAFAPDDSR